MRSNARKAAGGLLAALVLSAIAAASSARLDTDAPSTGLLRLTWSARPERIETCREQSPAEQAQLPAHMRQPRVCEGTSASYRLEVIYNDSVIDSRILRGGGLRRDRRMYVLRELPVPSGAADLVVRVNRIEEPSPVSDPVAPGSAAFVPAQLSLRTRLHVAPREVVLVTYDEQRRVLTAVQRTR